MYAIQDALRFGASELHIACIDGDIEFIKENLDKTNINVKDEKGYSPFSYACQRGLQLVTQKLIFLYTFIYKFTSFIYLFLIHLSKI
jgi:hypothetical protein